MTTEIVLEIVDKDIFLQVKNFLLLQTWKDKHVRTKRIAQTCQIMFRQCVTTKHHLK